MKKRFYQLGKQVLSLSAIIAGTLLFSNNEVSAQGVSINATGTGTAPDGSAILDLSVTNKGFLVPRMTAAQKLLIASPAKGLLIYQTDGTEGFYYNSGTPIVPVWTTFSGGGLAPTAGNDIDISGLSQVDIEPVLDFVHTINGAGGNPLTITAPASNDLIFGSGGVERARFLSTGNFGVGDNTPVALFTVGSGDKFRVDANGNLIRVNDLAYSWPTAHVANSVLVNDGSGNLIWTTDHVIGADLPSGYIWVGDASNNADEVLMSGDVAISNTGVATIQDNSVDGTDISITGESATNTVLQFNNGTSTWEAVSPSASNAWAILGNSNITSGTHFLGTTNAQALDIRTNNVIHQQITTKGQLYFKNTGGSVWIGDNAGNADTPGSNVNTFIGSNAGQNATGAENVFIGNNAGRNSTTGGYRVAVGAGAMAANTTGQYSTAVGYNALGLSTTSNSNTAIGYYALYAANSGNNVALGYLAGEDLTGSGNTFIGGGAGRNLTATNNSVALGFEAFMGNGGGATGSGVAIGYWALRNVTTGTNNTALGSLSLLSLTTGGQNTALGYEAGGSMVSGVNNVFVGHGAGYSTTGDGNVMLGFQAGANETGANKLYIDNSATTTPLIYGDFSANKLTVNSTLQIGSNGADGQFMLFSEQGGTDYTYTIIPNAAASQNITLTLPADDGTPNQILATDGSGGLSWATSFTNPMDQIGDIIYGSTAGAPSTPNDLDPGTAGMFLQTTGGVPAWSKVNLIDPLEVEGATEGELLIGASTGAAANLSAANMNTIRYSTGGAGSWLAATNLLNDGTDIGIATDPSAATSTTKLDIAGNVNATTGYYYTSGGVNNSDKSPMNVEVLENLPNTLNDYVEIGSFTTGAGAHNLRVSLTSDESQFSIAKTYVIVTNNDATGGAWQVVRPISDSGPFGSPDDNNFELLMRSNGAGVITLRIRNNNVGTAHTGTISVRIESLGKTDEEVFATSAASGNDATAYSTYSGSLSSNYIFNQTSQQASANFNISGSGSFGDGAAATPSITFGSDANTGIYRAGADILAFSTGGSARMQISAAGDVGVGTAPSGTYKFEVSGKVKSTGINETSDARLKMNFAAIDGALSKVLSMNGKYYDWRTSEFPQMNFTTGRQIGVIAQEIEKILPEVVTTGEDGYKAVEYSHIVPVLIEAIKEQQKIIDGQNSTITDLKASLENVLNRVNIIEKNVDLNTSKVNK